MTTERARGSEFAQTVTDHIFGYIDRHMSAPVMDSNCVTICGKITLARLHVRSTFFSLFWFIASIRFNSLGSTKGPFFNDRDILTSTQLTARLGATAHNVLIRFLVAAGFVAQGGLAPRTFRPGQTNRLASFTTAVRMVARGHG